MWNSNVYQPPGTYWEELPSLGLTPALPATPLTIIGEIPENISVTEDINISCIASELIYTVVDESSIIVTDASGDVTYTNYTNPATAGDYRIFAADDDNNTSLILWEDPPNNVLAEGSCGGGSLPNSVYTYVVEAVSVNGLETTGAANAANETLACSASIGQIALSWDPVTNAASYRIYRGDSTHDPTLLTTVTAPTTTFTDTGALSPNGITSVPQPGGSTHNCKVTYSYAQEDRFDVKLWTDVEDIESFYGNATDSNGNISCKLSFGCIKASYNGCQYLQTVGVPVGSSLETWINALELLRGEENVEVIVPLYYSTTFFSYCVGFINSMQAAGKFPFFIFGGTTSQNMEDMRQAIPGSGNENIVVLAYPSIEHFNDTSNTSYDINGYYGAAAIGGKMLSQQVYVPMTRKSITGVYSVPKIAPQKMDYLTTEGLFMLFNKQGQVTVRHGITTDQTNSATKEISVVRAKHYMLTLLMNDLNSVIVGTSLDEFTLVSAKSVTTSRLESLISARVINAYSDLKARLNTDEPTRIDIKFKYRPSWPINWVVIQFSVDMTTGEVQTTA